MNPKICPNNISQYFVGKYTSTTRVADGIHAVGATKTPEICVGTSDPRNWQDSTSDEFMGYIYIY